MSERLDTYISNDAYTVDGEAGLISHIFACIGTKSKVAVEFGAGDGKTCSNTARLWREEGWKALLIEPDPMRFQDLEANALPFDTICLQTFVTPEGPNSITSILDTYGIEEVDFMSIDIDGDDYFILQKLACRPRVICVEFNPTIPPHVDIRQKEMGEAFGASLLAIIRDGAGLGYRFVGATRCNAFLVIEPEAAAFDAYINDPEVLFPADRFTYAVTDYHGRLVLCGQPLPWQAKEPYVLPLVASTYVSPISDNPQYLRKGYESMWGPAWWLTPDGLSEQVLRQLLAGTRPRLVCVNLISAALGTWEWMMGVAEDHDYKIVHTGHVLGMIAKEAL